MSLFEVKPYDREFYEKNLRDFLPHRFIDAHCHPSSLKFPVAHDKRSGCDWPGMVAKENPLEDIIETNRLLFPENEVISVLYGEPNSYTQDCMERSGFPGLYWAHPATDADELERAVLGGGYKGIKVYLWYAPSYIPNGEIRIYDFLTREHLAVCDRHGWFVQLHIPRDGRLGDPVNYMQIREISESYPNITLSIAHLGRAYANENVGKALEVLKDTKNTVWDFTANTNAWVMARVLETFGPKRFFYGSDFPIFRMKARRVTENGWYINEVPKGSLGDVSVDPHMREIDYPEAERITFFIYEEIDSCRRACEELGLSKGDVNDIFFGNAARFFGVK